jgi:predicted metalloprotease with PDZ domain
MVREFARNIVQIKASAAGKKVTLKKARQTYLAGSSVQN